MKLRLYKNMEINSNIEKSRTSFVSAYLHVCNFIMIPDIQYWNIDLEYLSAADGTLETDLKCITEQILHKFQEAKEYKQKKI